MKRKRLIGIARVSSKKQALDASGLDKQEEDIRANLRERFGFLRLLSSGQDRSQGGHIDTRECDPATGADIKELFRFFDAGIWSLPESDRDGDQLGGPQGSQ
jgi:hypothetical protein